MLLKTQDEHLQETLLEFYYREFSTVRQKHDKDKPLVYPVDLYFLVNKLNIELTNNQNKSYLQLNIGLLAAFGCLEKILKALQYQKRLTIGYGETYILYVIRKSLSKCIGPM